MNKIAPEIGLKWLAKLKEDNYIWRLLIILVFWMLFMAITKFKQFYLPINFQTMGAQFPEYGLMALGVMFCMIAGGIDLSTVSVANITAITMALLMRYVSNSDGNISSYWVAIIFILAIIIGAVAGVFNGLLITYLKIPPILATLGTNTLYSGIGIVLTNGKAISDIPTTFTYSINSRWGGIPVQLIIFVVVAIILTFILSKTTFGKKLYLIGTNIKVAKYSGLRVKSLLIKTYMISGISAALAGVIMLANYSSARADYGETYTLQCILIVVLGGVSPNGGTGKISGVMLAIILVRMLETGINRFQSISSYYISLIWGAVLILALVLDYLDRKGFQLKK